MRDEARKLRRRWLCAAGVLIFAHGGVTCSSNRMSLVDIIKAIKVIFRLRTPKAATTHLSPVLSRAREWWRRHVMCEVAGGPRGRQIAPRACASFYQYGAHLSFAWRRRNQHLQPFAFISWRGNHWPPRSALRANVAFARKYSERSEISNAARNETVAIGIGWRKQASCDNIIAAGKSSQSMALRIAAPLDTLATLMNVYFFVCRYIWPTLSGSEIIVNNYGKGRW